MAGAMAMDPSLFPIPSGLGTHRPAFNNPFQPGVWPGVSPASTAMLQKILGDNHKRWHVFFNLQGFHKFVFFDFLLVSRGAHTIIKVILLIQH